MTIFTKAIAGKTIPSHCNDAGKGIGIIIWYAALKIQNERAIIASIFIVCSFSVLYFKWYNNNADTTNKLKLK